MKSELHAQLEVGVQAGFQNGFGVLIPLVEEVQHLGLYRVLLSSPKSNPKATFAVVNPPSR